MTTVAQAVQNEYNAAVRTRGWRDPLARKLSRDLAMLRIAKVLAHDLEQLERLDADQRGRFLKMPEVRTLTVVMARMAELHAREAAARRGNGEMSSRSPEVSPAPGESPAQDGEDERRDYPPGSAATRPGRRLPWSLRGAGLRAFSSGEREIPPGGLVLEASRARWADEDDE